jgi:SAM-dependent methyltransferase
VRLRYADQRHDADDLRTFLRATAESLVDTSAHLGTSPENRSLLSRPPGHGSLMNRVMALQNRLKQLIKPILFEDARAVHRVKCGPGRGVRLWINRMHNLQIEFGLWETELNSTYRRYIQPNSVVYDIGAGDGFTSLVYANLGAKVVAFEPDPDALSLFDENLRLNPELASRISVVRGAYAPTSSDAPASFIKIDVDGAEVDVLHLVPLAAAIIVETHAASLEEECQRLLRQEGYITKVVHNAWWRRFYPEYRPIELNRWLLAVRPPA